MRTDRSTLLRAALHTLALYAMPAAATAQDVISVNFTDTEAGSTITQGTPGAIPVPASNWTNANSTNGDGNVSDLIDDTGTPTGAAISWVSANTWRSGLTPTTGNGELTKGYLDDGGGGALISVSDIPYLLWNAYVIVGTDQGGGTQIDTAVFRPTTVNGLPYTWDGNATVQDNVSWEGQNWTEAETLTEGQNYLRVPAQGGLTGVIEGGGSGDGRGPIAGIQIENAYTGSFSYWDLNGTTAGAGGATPSGDWDAGTSNWGPAEDGTGSATTWPGAGTAAIFSAGTDATGDYTVNVSGTREADAVILEEGGLTLSGGALSLSGPSILRAGGTGLVVDTTLDGTQGLVLEGTSSVTLSGTHNVSGGAVVTVPALNLNSGTSLPNLGGLAVGENVAIVANDSSLNTTEGMSLADGSSLLFSNSTYTGGGEVNAAGSSVTVGGSASVTADSFFTNAGTNTGSVTISGDASFDLVGDGEGGQGQFQHNTGTVELSDSAVINTDRYVNTGNGENHTLNIGGDAQVNVTDDLVLGDNTDAVIEVNQSGGVVTNTGTTNNPDGNDLSNRWGHWGGANTTYNLDDGELNLTGAPLYLSWDSAATLNIADPAVANIAGFDMGYGGRGQISTINLDGGILNVGAFGIVNGGGADKNVNLGLGTLGATANWTSDATMNVTDAHTVDTGEFNIDLLGDMTGAGSLTKVGAGALALGGENTYAGPTDVDEGLLRLGGTTAGGVDVAAGASVGAGTSGDVGTGSVDTVNLADGGRFRFRLGEDFDQLVITDADGLTTAGSNPIDIGGGFGIGPGVYTLIDCEGTIAGDGFGALSLGDMPHISATLNHNTADTTVELDVSSVDSLLWTGDAGSDWDVDSAVNWFLQDGMTDAPYFQSDLVVFDDTAATGDVNVVGTITPADIEIDNSSLDYTFTGAPIAGTTDIFKIGTGTVTLLNDNTYTGSTIVDQGVLQVGDGTSGSISPTSDVSIGPDGEFVLIPASDGNFTNAVFNEGVFRLGGSSDVGLTGPFDDPNQGDIIIDSTGETSFTSGKAAWTGDLLVNSGTLRATGFGINSMGAGDETRTLTFESGTAFRMEQNNIFGGGGTELAMVPKVVLNGASLFTTRYNLLGDVDLNGATITGEPTDGPGTYEGYEMRGTYTVGGSAPSLIEVQNARHHHLDAATSTFNV